MAIQLLEFYANWATPSTELGKFLATLLKEDHNDIIYDRVDVDANANEAMLEKFDIQSVPLVVFLEMNDGEQEAKVLKRIEGFQPYLVKDALLQLSEKRISSNLPLDAVAATPHTLPNKAIFYHDQLSKELNERLYKLVNTAPVMLFIKGTPSHPQCGFTRQLLTLLTTRGGLSIYDSSLVSSSMTPKTVLTFDILSDDAVRQSLKVYSDWPTYPHVYVKGELVGGLDIVKAMMDANDWEQLFI